MNNLRGVFAKGAKSVFKAAGDIVVTATYVSNVPGEYDSTTDMTDVSRTEYPVAVILLSDKKTRNETNDKQQAYKKALLLAEDIAFIPKMEDKIVIETQEYIIGPVEIDPAGAVWTLELLSP
jgi:hypothetical protein